MPRSTDPAGRVSDAAAGAAQPQSAALDDHNRALLEVAAHPGEVGQEHGCLLVRRYRLMRSKQHKRQRRRRLLEPADSPREASLPRRGERQLTLLYSRRYILQRSRDVC